MLTTTLESPRQLFDGLRVSCDLGLEGPRQFFDALRLSTFDAP